MFVITTKQRTYRCSDGKTAADIIYGETGDENDYDRMIYILSGMEFGELFHGNGFVVQCFED